MGLLMTVSGATLSSAQAARLANTTWPAELSSTCACGRLFNALRKSCCSLSNLANFSCNSAINRCSLLGLVVAALALEVESIVINLPGNVALISWPSSELRFVMKRSTTKPYLVNPA